MQQLAQLQQVLRIVVFLCVCVCVCRTQVVVLGDSCSSSGARSLMGKVVAKLHYAVVLLQHFGYLHLNCGAELLPLKHTHTNTQRSGSNHQSHFGLQQKRLGDSDSCFRYYSLISFSTTGNSQLVFQVLFRQWFVLVGTFFTCMLLSLNIFYYLMLLKTTEFKRGKKASSVLRSLQLSTGSLNDESNIKK